MTDRPGNPPQSLNVLLAAQAGGAHGTGHLERARTLAHALREGYNAQCTFWIEEADSPLKHKLEQQGYRVVQGNWSLPEAVRQGDFNRLVIDFQTPVSPTLTEAIHVARPELGLIVVDNNGLGCAEADAVILPNLHTIPDTRWYTGQNTVYSGSPYIMLGAGFLHEDDGSIDSNPVSVPTLLVTLGGSDPGQVSEQMLEALRDLRDCHIDFVVPPLYAWPENLEKIATRMPSTITLHWCVKNLRPLMQRSNLALAAFGVTAYELAYMGVPSLLVALQESQTADLERFCQHESAINLGWSQTLNPADVLPQVQALLADKTRCRHMAAQGQQLIDTRGPSRAADIVARTRRQPVTVQSKGEPTDV